MGSLFDDIGGFFNQLGTNVHNLIGGDMQPSQPAPPPQQSLPPPPQPRPSGGGDKLTSPLGNLNPNQPQQAPPHAQKTGWEELFADPGKFSQDMGLTQLLSDMGQKSTDVSAQLGAARDLAGKDLAEDFSTNKALRLAVGVTGDITPDQAARMGKAGTNPFGYVADVLNAGIVDPIQLAADPQMWFASDNNAHDPNNATWNNSPFNTTSPGHNYLRDIFAPMVKNVTGEDVPPTMYDYKDQAQALQEEQDKLLEAQTKLESGQASQIEIDAFNAQLAQYQTKFNDYQTNYQKSVDWWTNSPTSKVLSLAGQAVTFPAGFAAGMVTFFPQLISDPGATAQSMVAQVKQAGQFAMDLNDQDKRDNMSAQELASNISNVVMLGGMLFGAKGLATHAKGYLDITRGIAKGEFTAEKGLQAGPFRNVNQSRQDFATRNASGGAVSRAPAPMARGAAKQEVITRLAMDRMAKQIQEHSSDIRNPEQAPRELPFDPTSASPEQFDQHITQRETELQSLQDQYTKALETDNLPLQKSLMNDMTSIRDEINAVKNRPKLTINDYKKMSNGDLITAAADADIAKDQKAIDATETEIQARGGFDAIESSDVKGLRYSLEQDQNPAIFPTRDAQEENFQIRQRVKEVMGMEPRELYETLDTTNPKEIVKYLREVGETHEADELEYLLTQYNKQNNITPSRTYEEGQRLRNKMDAQRVERMREPARERADQLERGALQRADLTSFLRQSFPEEKNLFTKATQDMSTDDLLNKFRLYNEVAKNMDDMGLSKLAKSVRFLGREIADELSARAANTSKTPESRAAVMDAITEMRTEQPGLFTRPVRPEPLFEDQPTDILGRGKEFEEFTPDSQLRAGEGRPNLYASRNQGPVEITNFEDFSPRTISNLASTAGYDLVPVDRITGNAWIRPDGKAINLGMTADHTDFADNMKQPGDNRNVQQVEEGLKSKGWIKVSDAVVNRGYAVDRLDPENIKLIEKSIKTDLQGSSRQFPYIIDASDSGKSYKITPQDFAAHNFDLESTILAKIGGHQSGTPQALAGAIRNLRWKEVPAGQVDYGWVFDDGKGVDIRSNMDQDGWSHGDLMTGYENSTGTKLSAPEWRKISKNFLQIRGEGNRLNVWVDELHPGNQEVLQDYLKNHMPDNLSREVMVEDRTKVAQKSNGAGSAALFTFEDFKNNGYKLEGLMKSPPVRGGRLGALDTALEQGNQEIRKTMPDIVPGTSFKPERSAQAPIEEAGQDLIRLYHGTTNRALENVQKEGLKPINTHKIVNDLEIALSLPTDSIWDHPDAWLAKAQPGLDDTIGRVSVATHPDTAGAYARRFGETLDHALTTAYQLTHAGHRYRSGNDPAMMKWKASIADQLGIQPIVVELEVPWSKLVDNRGLFEGMTREEYQSYMKEGGYLPNMRTGAIGPEHITRAVGMDRIDEFLGDQKPAEYLRGYPSPADFQKTTSSPYLYDAYLNLKKLNNKLDWPGNDVTIKGNAKRMVPDIQKAQHIIDTLPKEGLSKPLQDMVKQIQEKINESSVQKALQASANRKASAASKAGQTSEGSDRAQTNEGQAVPEGIEEGSTLTTVVPSPQNGEPVAFWKAPSESAGTLSPRERGALEQRQELKNLTDKTLAYNPDVTPSLTEVPVNIERRETEVVNNIKDRIGDLDPLRIAPIKHIVFDSKLKTDAEIDPTTGVITLNPAKMIPEVWAKSAAISLQRSFRAIKDKLSVEAVRHALGYMQDILAMKQSDWDFFAASEEVMHKYDIDYFNNQDYLLALGRLPVTWWEHATRSGLGDNVEGGVTWYNHAQKKYVPLKTKDGNVVNSWLSGYDLALADKLDGASVDALTRALSEYRVTQLLNYHGIKGSKYTYRVPEVMVRELEYPELIEEGARLAGDDFERYVRAETAPRMALPTPYEETIAGQRTAEAGVPPEFTGETVGPADSAAVSNAPAARVPGRDAGNQENLRTEPFAQSPSGFTDDVPDSVGKRFEYRPLLNLGKTGYPGGWEDFLRAMNSDPQSQDYLTAKPYWDKLNKRDQGAWQEAMKSPTIRQIMAEEPKQPEVFQSEAQSPTHLARQKEIKQAMDDIARSGKEIDAMYKTNMKPVDYEQIDKARAIVAMKRKFAELPANVPRLEAIQLSKQEGMRALEQYREETKAKLARPGSKEAKVPQLPQGLPRVPQRGARAMQIQPEARKALAERVRVLGNYTDLEDFFNDLLSGNKEARKAYNLLNPSKREAVKLVTGFKPGKTTSAPQTGQIPITGTQRPNAFKLNLQKEEQPPIEEAPMGEDIGPESGLTPEESAQNTFRALRENPIPEEEQTTTLTPTQRDVQAATKKAMTWQRKNQIVPEGTPFEEPVPGAQEAVSKTVYNLGLKDKAEAKTADIKGELVTQRNIDEQLQGIAGDISNPAHLSAARAINARDAITTGMRMGVPKAKVDEYRAAFAHEMSVLSGELAGQAAEAERAAPLTAPAPRNKWVFDVSLAKAKQFKAKIAQGVDWHQAASEAARDMGFGSRPFGSKMAPNPIEDLMAKMKDAKEGFDPTNKVHSLAPSFRDIFKNPKVADAIRKEKLAAPPKQSPLLPLPMETLLGTDLPVSKEATGKVTFKPGKANPTNRIVDDRVVARPGAPRPVQPAIAQTLKANTPSPHETPRELTPKEIQQQVEEDLADPNSDHNTQTLREEDQEITKFVTTPSPNPFEDIMLENFKQDKKDEARVAKTGLPTRQAPPKPSAAAGGGEGGDGGGHEPPQDPFEGWADPRDHGRTFPGLERAINVLDRAVKREAKIYAPSRNTAHPVKMALDYIYARVAGRYTTKQIREEIGKVVPPIPAKGPIPAGALELNRNMAKAIGGDNEFARKQALNNLTPEQQALANAIHAYHKVTGRIGVVPETHIFDEAAENYLHRRVLFDEFGKQPGTNPDGTLRMSKKMSIAFDRRRREVIIGTDDNGQPIIRTENYYTEDQGMLWDTDPKTGERIPSGFKIDESLANRLADHYDQFNNMNITQQLIRDLSTLHGFKEKSFTGGVGGRGLTKGSDAWMGKVLILDKEVGQLDPETNYRNQVRKVTRGPFVNALKNYHVYRPVADELERLASVKVDASNVEHIANAFSHVNGIYKVMKFVYNPIHAFNLMSSVYVMGTKGVLDPALVNPKLLYGRIYGRTDSLLNETGKYSDWDGADIKGTDMIHRILEWGGTLREDILTSANLAGTQDYANGRSGGAISLQEFLAKQSPGFKQWHNFMWHGIAWKGHIGLTLHLLDVQRAAFLKETGREMNEAEFNNAGKLATEQSKYAMGFIDKPSMSRDWQIYGNSMFFANSWTLSQLRILGMAIPQGVPGAKFLSNLGGGETGDIGVGGKGTLTRDMAQLGEMDQGSVDFINSYRGKFARQMMLGGLVKLMATSTVLAYIGSYIGNQGQAQGPYENFQRDATHTFDIYLGTDQATGKDMWQHNPLFGREQEMALYALQVVKDLRAGDNPYEALMSGGGRFANKLNPIFSTPLSILMNRQLSLYMQGYGDNSNIHDDKTGNSPDKNILAIRRALDATHAGDPNFNWEDNLIYAVRQLFPSPGFPSSPDTQNSTLGNTLNALGPGKVLGAGDLVNAIQRAANGEDWQTAMGDLLKVDTRGLLEFATGSRHTTSSTPAQIATNNQIGASVATANIRDDAIAQMTQAAYKGDWKTVADIVQVLGLSNGDMIQALEHPPSGHGAGPGILYNGLPQRDPNLPPQQDILMNQVLTPAQTSEFETLKGQASLSAIKQITNLPEFKTADGTQRAAMMAAYLNLVNRAVSDQYSQKLGFLGGTPITNDNIQSMLNTSIEFHGQVSTALRQSDYYNQADPIDRQRMETTFNAYAISLAHDAYFGSLKGVPLENVQEILNNTIQVEGATRDNLKNSMFYQLAAVPEQNRMMNEYSALARTIAKRQALGQGQGSHGDFRLPADKMIPTINFIMNVEELGKATLHGKEFYITASPAEQRALDSKYETLARGLGFSTSGEDPRGLIANAITAEESYYGLKNQFGGSAYIDKKAAELAKIERDIRTSSDFMPWQITKITAAIRKQFLVDNPQYAAWLKMRTMWARNTAEGQMYRALNSSEFAALDNLDSSGTNTSDSILLSGSTLDNTTMDPGAGLPDQGLGSMGLPENSFANLPSY